MAIQAILDKIDDVDEKYRDLYTEKDGKFELTGVVGFKTQADVDRVKEALRKEKTDHGAHKEKWRLFADKEPGDILTLLDRIPELEAAASGNEIDADKMEELLGKRLATKLAPIERDRVDLQHKLDESLTTIDAYEKENVRRSIHDGARKGIVEMKTLDTASEDILMLAERVFEVSEDGKILTKDNSGCTPGIEPKAWLLEMQASRPHWWGESTGGGGSGNNGKGGGFANNPWTKDHWNMTEQGKALIANRSQAEQMAKSAGSSIGAIKPTESK